MTMPLSDVTQEPTDADWLLSRHEGDNGAWDKGVEDPNAWAGDAKYGQAAAGRWSKLQGTRFEAPELDPQVQQQLSRAQMQNAEARQQQLQMYSLAQNWANGAATPQQQQMRQGFDVQRIGTNAVANAAVGGARGAIAARQGAGMQTAQDAQFNALALQQQKAKDQQLGQQMMMNAANQMRAGDQQALNAANEYAMQGEQRRMGWQKLNDDNRLFYGNMSDNQKLAMSGVQLENAEQQQQLAMQDEARKQALYQGGMSAAAGAFEYGAKAWGKSDNGGE